MVGRVVNPARTESAGGEAHSEFGGRVGKGKGEGEIGQIPQVLRLKGHCTHLIFPTFRCERHWLSLLFEVSRRARDFALGVEEQNFSGVASEVGTIVDDEA